MRFCFNNPILEFCSAFDPKTAISDDIKSITYFPQLVRDIDKPDFEWQLLADSDEVKKYINSDFEAFWGIVFNLNTHMLENLFVLMNRFSFCVQLCKNKYFCTYLFNLFL